MTTGESKSIIEYYGFWILFNGVAGGFGLGILYPSMRPILFTTGTLGVIIGGFLLRRQKRAEAEVTASEHLGG